MRRLGRGALAVALLLLAACGNGEMRPRTLVDGVRILAVKAEPPEIAPLEESALSLLAVDPLGRRLGYLWLACDPVFDPEPGSVPYSACESTAVVTDPAAAGELLSSGAARPLSLGLTASAVTYTPPTDANGAPVDLLAPLPEGDPRRRLGGSITLLVVAAPLADLEALLADPEATTLDPRQAAIALKRITLSEAEVPNANPILEGIQVAGVRSGSGEWLDLRSDDMISLVAVAGPGSDEDWTLVHPDGRETVEHETLVASWYATAGGFNASRTLAGEPNRFYAPGGRGELRIWVVLRDGRGGTDWAVLPVSVGR